VHLRLCVLCPALLLLSACSSAAAPAPTPASQTKASPNASESAAKPASLDHIKLSLSTYAGVFAPFLIAADKGYYAAQGLDIEFVLQAGGLAVPALLSGEVPYTSSAATAMGAIIKGAPAKVIYTNSDRSVQQLWAQPDITTLDQLKGKSIGVASRGDSNEVTIRILFAQKNIDISSVIFTAVGSPAGAMAALQSGAVNSAVIGSNILPELERSGYKGHMLYDLQQVQLLYNGLATTDKELQQNRDRARRLLYATLQGREYDRAFKDQSIQVMAKYDQQSLESNAADYDTSLRSMTADGTMPVEAQKADTLVRAQLVQVPASEVPPVEKLYDYSIIQQANQELKASGWKPAP
jgi:NitT/TauT family transport system substrate-binding protein